MGMHGPEGADYPNRVEWLEPVPLERIVCRDAPVDPAAPTLGQFAGSPRLPFFWVDDTILSMSIEPQSTSLQIEWAPAYELVLSFIAFAERRHHKLIDLGPEWVKAARARLPAAFRDEIAHLDQDLCKKAADPMVSLARLAPEPRDAASWLDWLGGRTVGALYELLAPIASEDEPLPRDLGAARDLWHRWLSLWEEHYFRGVDPAIPSGLTADCERLRRRIGRVPAVELIEEATSGIWIDPTPERPVTLVPMYHGRPTNHLAREHPRTVICYPAEVLPPAPDQPPAPLVRLARALGDESRLRILRVLASGGPYTLTDVARATGLSQSTVHHHLIALRAAGLTRAYQLTPPRYSLRPNADARVAEALRAFLNG